MGKWSLHGAGARSLALALTLTFHGAPATAQLATLATSLGDGSVTIQLDAYGSFGYQTHGSGQGDAIYDPVGSVGPSSTSWESAVYMRMPPASTFLSIGLVGTSLASGNLPDPGFTFQDGTTATSTFTHAGLRWDLTQTVQDLVVGFDRVGTMLVQQYLITNTGASTVSFDLVRYYEGDLFLGLGAGVPDGGGHLFVGPEELVFETDLAGEPSTTTNLVGITACGGVTPLVGRYEVNRWPAFPDRISSDMPLADVVFNDGTDPDEFVDRGLDYDVGIALCNQFSIGPGQVVAYVTTTVFGQLPPDDVSQGCAAQGPPFADAGPDQSACPDQEIALDGSASFDSDIVDGGRIVSWTWDMDVSTDTSGNGLPDDDVDATGRLVRWTFPLGTTVVKLTYTDDDGATDTDFVTITIEDLREPAVTCPAEVVVPTTGFDTGTASPMATATDDCDASPSITNDRTTGGADATDEYPCGTTRVVFTATDDTGKQGTCATLVRVVPDPLSNVVGAALRVSKRPDQAPVLDWSLWGMPAPDDRFVVLRETIRVAPSAPAPGADALPVTTWTDTVAVEPLVFYDVRIPLCDGSLSAD